MLVLVLDQVSYISHSPKSALSDLSLADGLANYYNNRLDAKSTKSFESLFHQKPRVMGHLNLSEYKVCDHVTDLQRISPELKFGGGEEQEDIKQDSVKLAKKYLPADLFRTLNEPKPDSNNKAASGLKFGPYGKIPATGDSTIDLKARDLPIPGDSHAESHGSDYAKGGDFAGFAGNNLELTFRQQLENNQVVPRSTVVLHKFNRNPVLRAPMEPSNGNISTKANSNTTTNTTITTDNNTVAKTLRLKRLTIKNMLTLLQWRKTKITSDSAELENQIFSPGTHRPSTHDVPSIYQVQEDSEYQQEDEENEGYQGNHQEAYPEECIRNLFRSSTLTFAAIPSFSVESLLQLCRSECSSDSSPGPVPQSRFIRGCRKIRDKCRFDRS